MDLSGIIFVVLALAWAVYLIPQALKRHDEIARTRSIDRFSSTMRVLARREPVNRRDSRLVVTPARHGTPRLLVPTTVAAVGPVVASSEAPTAEAVRRPGARPAWQHAAARAAARRRRHLLILLVLVDLAVGGVAAFGYLPWWSVSISAGLTLAYLFLFRQQVRRDKRAARSRPVVPADDSAAPPRRAVRVEVLHGTSQASPDEQGFEVASSAEDTISTGRGSLWEPLPMTLPTYVNKPRAARTVRTIDLSEPNTWSSGRSEADSKLVEEATAARDEASRATDERRAVSS